MIYEMLSTQARIILNVDDLSSAGQMDVQLANQEESADKIEDCLERKRMLYERFVLRQISEASGLTAGLVDALIDRVYFYPENQVEVILKIKDFCGGAS